MNPDVQSPVPFLAVFTIPRSGSNRLFDLLAARNGVVSLNEFFGRTPRGLSHELRAASIKPFGDWERFAEVGRVHPVETMKFLEGYPDARLATIKIHPRHLDVPGPARELIDASSGNIFLRRNPLAVWISRRIVRESRSWAYVNTDRYVVPFDPEDFCLFTVRSLRKLGAYRALADESPTPTFDLTYRDVERFRSSQDVWTVLADAFPHIPVEGVDPNAPERFTRQDSRLPFDRLSNPEEARSWLISRELESLIENSDDFDADRIIASVSS